MHLFTNSILTLDNGCYSQLWKLAQTHFFKMSAQKELVYRLNGFSTRGCITIGEVVVWFVLLFNYMPTIFFFSSQVERITVQVACGAVLTGCP